jgi:hypothetical protein
MAFVALLRFFHFSTITQWNYHTARPGMQRMTRQSWSISAPEGRLENRGD